MLIRDQFLAAGSAFVVAFFAGAAVGLSAGAATAPLPSRAVRQIQVLPDRAPDCTSLRSIAESVTRGCRNNDEKAVVAPVVLKPGRASTTLTEVTPPKSTWHQV